MTTEHSTLKPVLLRILGSRVLMIQYGARGESNLNGKRTRQDKLQLNHKIYNKLCLPIKSYPQALALKHLEQDCGDRLLSKLWLDDIERQSLCSGLALIQGLKFTASGFEVRTLAPRGPKAVAPTSGYDKCTHCGYNS